MPKEKLKRKWILPMLLVIAATALIASAVYSSRKAPPPQTHERKRTKDWLTSIPAVDSEVKDLEIINPRIIRLGTQVPAVEFEVRNKSNLAVMAIEITCGEAGLSKDGLGDPDHPIVIIPPHGTLTAEMNEELSPGLPIVITEATFEDGSERGRESSVTLMQKLRVRERSKRQAEKERSTQEKPEK
jgi:hypothetical protein